MDNCYKSMDYCMITEQMTDSQLELFNDSIDNYLAMNYGTADYGFAHLPPKLWSAVHRYVDKLEKML
jgi:hypothetical protein